MQLYIAFIRQFDQKPAKLPEKIGGPRAEVRLACGHPPIGLRDEPIEFDRRRSRSAYQTQSNRPSAGFAALGRLAR